MVAKADYTAETGDAEREVIELALKRRKACIDAEAPNTTDAENDVRFAKGDQWPDNIQTARENDGQPCLTINKTGQYVRQVVNDSRQNSPSMKFFPVGGGADQDIANILNGLARDVQQRTDADVAYDTAVESTARCGKGFFRLVARYSDDEGFEQELAFSRMRNPFAVHLDPAAQDPAGADARFGFVDQWLPTEEVEDQYGVDALAGLDTNSLGEFAPNWIVGDSILIAEYYTVEEGQKRTQVMLKGGAIAILEELSEPPQEDDIVAMRQVRVTRCIWRKITGTRVLEKTIWPCKYIPVFQVIGEEFEVDGKVYTQGLIRPMKDSQRMYNYWVTSATEKGALESKAPYIGAEGQFEGHEHEWNKANKLPLAYLEYKPITVEDQLAPPPARNQATFAGQTDVFMADRASDDMKTTAGMYDPALGAKSNETSGKAILARQRESDTGTFHYTDNLARAIRHCGRVFAAVAPKIYNSERVIRILGEDDSEEMVTINGREKDDDGNIKAINDITIGRYDVRVATGPSYTTRRLEASESMIAFVQAIPEAGQGIMDLLAKSMDWPGADEIAARLRKMIPPQLLGEEGDDDEGITPAQVEAMIAQTVEQLQQQFEESLAERDMQIKEATAMAEINAKLGENEDHLREVVGGLLAEFLQEVGTGVESPAAAEQ